jgi:hypothetical protein
MSHQPISALRKRWSLREDMALIQSYESGATLGDMATENDCSVAEVEQRINHMKVIGAGLRRPPPGPFVTPTGIVVGGAFMRPPPAPSADAEAIQAAVLPRPAQERVAPGLWSTIRGWVTQGWLRRA